MPPPGAAKVVHDVAFTEVVTINAGAPQGSGTASAMPSNTPSATPAALQFGDPRRANFRALRWTTRPRNPLMALRRPAGSQAPCRSPPICTHGLVIAETPANHAERR